MDAKAKVVAWLSPDPDGTGNGLGMLMHDTEQTAALRGYFEPKGTVFIPLIPLTDHEAAMARSEFETNACAKAADHFRLKLKDAENNYLALLTGLEALAGDLDVPSEIASRLDALGMLLEPGDEIRDEIFSIRAEVISEKHKLHDRIRTLTNSAKGGE